MEKKLLKVDWTMTAPPPLPSQWYEWDQTENLRAEPWEIPLEWPAGTHAILRSAFERQLSRSVGWDFRFCGTPEAFAKAASVFRRGVASYGEKLKQDAGSYEIRIIDDLDSLKKLPGPTIIDSKVAQAWKIPPSDRLLPIELNEQSKTLESTATLGAWLKTQASGTLNIIGGGLLADTASFAAALQGRAFQLVPTTLLAMLDACIGGKTGVNFPPYGKNQVGLFAFPSQVLIATGWLKTLPVREFYSGLAEAYKHALIAGDRKLAAAVANFDPTRDAIDPLLFDLIRVKADIVAQDPTEQGIRAVLNLGHTLAHAWERIAHQQNADLLHGEAVGIGLLFMLRLSFELGLLPQADFQMMNDQLQASGIVIPRSRLETLLHGANLLEYGPELVKGVAQDKKNRNQDSAEWVLLEGWGKPHQSQGRYTKPVAHTDFIRVYQIFLNHWKT